MSAAGLAIPHWLEALEGRAPILLIAPHGGRAGAHAQALTAPRVNDLHTAELTRELARRLDAPALINVGMDRNRVDCNRVSELIAHAPWLLATIAERLEAMVAAHGRALVLAIHGWNLVEPRIDIGVGLTERSGAIAPSRGGHVSVSDRFLEETLGALVKRLKHAGIVATFGIRYPAAGAQNLVQAFTARHLRSEVGALQRIAALGARGAIEAVQLELSIALRFPGPLREAAIESLAAVLKDGAGEASVNGAAPADIAHIVRTPVAPRTHKPVRWSARLGFEFYDPAHRIGAMASFDLGAGGGGGRVMILTPAGAVVLFTGERGGRAAPGALRVGALSLDAAGRRPRLEYVGPALITPDAAAYIDIERALALSSLETETALTIEFEPAEPFDLEAARAGVEADGARAIAPRFGAFSGRLKIGARSYSMTGVSRIGPAFTALDDGGFEARRMLWALGANGDHGSALQATEFLDAGAWQPASEAGALRILALDPPAPISAALTSAGGGDLPIAGEIVSQVPLMRSDARGRRFRTTLGFAEFAIDGRRGFGMFEASRRAGERITGVETEEERG